MENITYFHLHSAYEKGLCSCVNSGLMVVASHDKCGSYEVVLAGSHIAEKIKKNFKNQTS